MSKKFAVISSTGASVVKTVYANTHRAEFDLDLMVVDRDCGAKEFALSHDIPVEIIGGDVEKTISDEAAFILKERKIDYVYLFFTRLLNGQILDVYSEKIINFHPSLLPACPGLHGFEDTLKSGAMLAGSTAHLVDAGIDTGRIIYQSFVPVHSVPPEHLRHVIFAQQCATLYAIHKSLKNNLPLLEAGSLSNCLKQGFLPNIDADAFRLYQKVRNKG